MQSPILRVWSRGVHEEPTGRTLIGRQSSSGSRLIGARWPIPDDRQRRCLWEGVSSRPHSNQWTRGNATCVVLSVYALATRAAAEQSLDCWQVHVAMPTRSPTVRVRCLDVRGRLRLVDGSGGSQVGTVFFGTTSFLRRRSFP